MELGKDYFAPIWRATWDDAIKYAQSKGMYVPTKREFELMEKSGIELKFEFWTSTIDTNESTKKVKTTRGLANKDEKRYVMVCTMEFLYDLRNNLPIKENVELKKSLYKSNGFEYNKDGLELSQKYNKYIQNFYSYWIELGFNPSEIREIIVSETITTASLINALKS